MRRVPSVRARVVVSGAVQGVGFRFATRDEAIRLGVTGWVRNRADGRVEAIFEGDESGVRELVAWCRIGPPDASVADVAVAWEEPSGTFETFRIER